MAITLTTVPTYPVPGKKVRVTFVSTYHGNWIRVAITAAPKASSWAKELENSPDTRKRVYEGDSSQEWIADCFDAPGIYTLYLEDLTKGTPYGGSYAGDPLGNPTETINGSSSVYLAFGQKLTAIVGTAQDNATLTTWVWTTTIRPTVASEYSTDEVTPSLTAHSSPRARNACQASAVTTQLAALSNQSAQTVTGTWSTIIDNIIDKFNAHCASATFHAVADTYNQILPEYKTPATPERTSEVLAYVRRKFEAHCKNDNDTSGTVGSVSCHKKGDWNNLPIVTGPSDPLSNGLNMADLWRCYENHRASTAVHNSADSTNTLSTLPALLELYRLILVELAKSTPSVASTENQGAIELVQMAGMKEG